MAPTYIGSTLVEQPQTKRFSYERGMDFVVHTWLGTPDAVAAKAEEIKLVDGWEDISYDLRNPASLSAMWVGPSDTTYDYDADAEDNAIWELIPEEVQNDLATNPKMITSGSSLEWIEKIERALEQGVAMQSDWGPSVTGVDDLNNYAKLRACGVTSYLDYAYTIRKSWSITKNSTKQIATNGLMACIAYSAIGLPDRVKWEEPKDDKDRAYVWMVMPPSVTRRGKYDYEITQEWRGGHYSPSLYAGGDIEPWNLGAIS